MSLSNKQKQAVRAKAGDCCEYCRLSQSGSFARFHVDHIIALKHGGTDADDNLCLACPDCTAHKGENVAALDPLTHDATKLYNPRHWRLSVSGATLAVVIISNYCALNLVVISALIIK